MSARIVPSTLQLMARHSQLRPGRNLPLLQLHPPVFEGLDYFAKRSFDLVVASMLLMLLAPVMLGCALAIKLTSRGPILFRSWGRGLGAKPFAAYKFRSMYRDLDLEVQEDPKPQALFRLRFDPRVTPVGRVLRRWALDRLPQLFNVLRGEMSLVGPPTLPERDFQRLEEWHLKRYLVMPGMTGMWQVSNRTLLDFDELVRTDFHYLERWSVVADIAILLQTIPALLRRRLAF